jgi:hypothetical protein
MITTKGTKDTKKDPPSPYGTTARQEEYVAIKTFVLLLFSVEEGINQKFMEQRILTIVLESKSYV